MPLSLQFTAFDLMSGVFARIDILRSENSRKLEFVRSHSSINACSCRCSQQSSIIKGSESPDAA